MSLGSSLLATLANSGTAGVVLAVTACLAAVSMGGGFAGVTGLGIVLWRRP